MFQLLAISFVSPGFIFAGIALAAIPIIIHLLNRRRFKVVPWAAMEFLRRAIQQNRRRMRFESWLLLLVRCLVLGLLGAALARPTGCQDTGLAALAARRSGLHVLVIDNSLPMDYQADRPDAKTDLDQAKKLARGLVDRLSAGGESVAIITTARPAALLTATPLYDLEAAKSVIDRIDQSYAAPDMTGALAKALDVGRAADREPNRTLNLIDASCRATWSIPGQAEALNSLGRQLGQLFHITHFDLARTGQWNQAVTDIKTGQALMRVGFDNSIPLTVASYGNDNEATVHARLDDEPLDNPPPLHPTAEGQTIDLKNLPLHEGGPHALSVSLASGDRLAADDNRYRILDVASELKVLIVEGERGIGPLSGSGAFLQAALAPPPDSAAAQHSVSYVSPELISDLEFPSKVLGDYRAVILAGVGQISPQEADALHNYVSQGGALILFMGDHVDGESYNQTLLPRGLLPGPLSKTVGDPGSDKTYQLDFDKNTTEPLLRVFHGLDRSGLETAEIYRYWQIALPPNTTARTVLSYLPDEHGHRDPAITTHDLGRGHVVFVSTTANADWTSLPAKPAYIALVHELLAGSVDAGDSWMNLIVGQSLELPASMQLTTTPTLKDPMQADVILEQSTAAGGAPVYHSPPLRRPGIYRLSTGIRSLPIAVNVPTDASDLRPIDPAALRKTLGDVDLETLADQLPPEEAVSQAGNDYGWSALLLVLALVGVESVLAMRFGHYRR